MSINFEAFIDHPFYDELITAKGNSRAYARKLYHFLDKLQPDELQDRQTGADVQSASAASAKQ